MRMEIIAPERSIAAAVPGPTEKYSQQFRLTNDHRSMVGYVAGQAFPLIDRRSLCCDKIMWNNVFRPISTDDYDLRFYDCQSEYVRPGQDQKVIDDIEIGHYAGYNLFGRPKSSRCRWIRTSNSRDVCGCSVCTRCSLRKRRAEPDSSAIATQIRSVATTAGIGPRALVACVA